MRNIRIGEMMRAGIAEGGAGEEGIRPPRADLQADAADQQQRLDVEQLVGGAPEAGDQRKDEEVEDDDEQHRLDPEAHRSERLARRRQRRVAQDRREFAGLEEAGTGRPLLDPLRGHSPLLHDSAPNLNSIGATAATIPMGV